MSTPIVYERSDATDLRALPLGPEEAFVLSLVDGVVDAEAIASSAGLDPDRVGAHLDRLRELGAIRVAPPRPRPSRRPSAATPSSAAVSARDSARAAGESARAGNAPRGSGRPSTPPMAATVISSAPLSGDVDPSLSLSVELQRRILDLSARLSDLDHFQVLGVEMSADRAQVKRAYFSMIGTFHPDSYFGKELGGFTKRMERIFQRLTEAHDVLSNAKAREEYESYLRVLGRTRELEELAAKPPPSMEELEALLIQAEKAAARTPSSPTGPIGPIAIVSPVPAPRPAKAPPAMQQAPSLRPSIEMVDDPAARRQALARKFGKIGGAVSPAPVAPTDEQIRDQAARRTAAVKELHQRYKHRQNSIKEQRVERFASAAEQSLAAGNTVSALNALKIARSLSGGDLGTVERLEELEKQLGTTMVDAYIERARYEENNGQHEKAARSYTQAARGRPNADVFRSAAECYLKAGVELRLASELAREAVQIAPNRVDLVLTLAKIYEAAGMQQNVLRELERALELTPDSDRVKQWLKRIKRGGV
ncbi:MAG TPA: DnaJ domain-containing protein [Polyangiaceae bacterium]|nr:DnaJ domain-containing protein [Polyangiaceae bacterium]